MKAPFPYFGGKAAIAHEVWARLGNVPNYVEGFFGSGAVLLSRPHEPGIETVNDIDGLVANFWRAVKLDPYTVAYHADWPVNENDLTARHLWLIRRKDGLPAKLEGNPDWYDAKIAGWWLWGICSWIGSGWCSGKGPWTEVNGELVRLGNIETGVKRTIIHLAEGRGINRKHEGNTCTEWSQHLREMMQELSNRLRRVRVCCGDWTRVIGWTPTEKLGLTGIFLDPPYSRIERYDDIYCEDHDVAAAVREWALANGNNPLLRIVLCGYDGEHEMPETWERLEWKTQGGYGAQGNGRGRENATREVVWFSPSCLKSDRVKQGVLL